VWSRKLQSLKLTSERADSTNMTWCLFGLLSLLTIQDPQPPQAQPEFEIVDLGPAASKKSSRAVSTRKAKPIEIKMPKKKRGESKLTKPKRR
jgi:hypothetical protein